MSGAASEPGLRTLVTYENTVAWKMKKYSTKYSFNFF